MTLIPYDDRDGWIWFDGEFVPWREATIHVITHGLHYGSCVFEGERSYGGKIFKMVEHHQRLIDSAEILGFQIPYSRQELDDAACQVLEKNNIVDGYVRPVAWRGSEQMGISAQQTKIHVAIAAWDWPAYYPKEMLENGIKMKTAKWKRPSPETAPSHAKAAGLYMICTVSKHQVEEEGCQDALMLDYRGYVAEATSANIFFFTKDGVIHTPTPDCFLNGLTRQTVIELAKENGIEVIERHIMPDELGDFESVFLTGTAAEVMPVGQIDSHSYTVNAPTKLLLEKYQELTRS